MTQTSDRKSSCTACMFASTGVKSRKRILHTCGKDKPTISKTDCRTEDGITVGLIDSLISIARVLAPSLREMYKRELSEPVLEALKDLTTDEDVLSVLRTVSSRCIISEERADVFEQIVEGAKKKVDTNVDKLIVNNPCPECQNTEFKILNTMVKAGTKKEFQNPVTGKKRTQSLNAGRYRVECTQCGHTEVVVSKHPSADPRYNKPEQLKAKKR